MASIIVHYGEGDKYRVQFKLARNGQLISRYLRDDVVKTDTAWEVRESDAIVRPLHDALKFLLLAYE